MATSDISKEALFDPRILQNPPRYAVGKGGLSYTNSPFNAISATASQHTYNINVPSQNVFLDRALNFTTTPFLQFNAAINSAIAPFVAGQPVVKFGQDVALTAFPVQSMIATLTATINDTNTTINLDTVQKEVLRLTDFAANRKQRTCPTKLDRYQNYNDSFLAVNTPLASYLDATEDSEVPNGAYFNVQFTNSTGALLVGSGSYSSGGVTVNFVNGIPVRTDAGGGADPASYPLFIRFTSTEHLLLSPFIYADSYEYSTGLFGINNIQLVMNFKSGEDVGRVLRNSTTGGRTISAVGFNQQSSQGAFVGSRVDCLFITPSLDIPLPAKSIVPYYEFPRYLTTGSEQIQPGAIAQVVSQTITLPQIPDMLIIYVKPQAIQPNSVSDFYLPIQNVSINFDNFSGLLASHSREQLYQLSNHNGLCMDYNEWNGRGYSATTGGIIPLVGGYLVLRPGQDFAVQAGQASSLVGNFTLQYNVTVLNQSASALTPVLTTIAVNSGFFETLAGSSRIIKGVLNEADIISAPMAPEGTRQELARIVGSGFLSNMSNMLSKAKDMYMKVKPGSDVGKAISMAKGSLPAGVARALGDVGYGASGAGMNGMGMNGMGMNGMGRAGAGRKKMLSERLM